MSQNKSSSFKEINIRKDIERFIEAETNKSKEDDYDSSAPAFDGSLCGTSVVGKISAPKVKI